MGGWDDSPRGRAFDYCTYSRYPNKDYNTRQLCIDDIDRVVEEQNKRNPPPLEETSNNDVTVEDKRSIFDKSLSNYKNLIMLVGVLGVGYFVYKKYYKK